MIRAGAFAEKFNMNSINDILLGAKSTEGALHNHN